MSTGVLGSVEQRGRNDLHPVPRYGLPWVTRGRKASIGPEACTLPTAERPLRVGEFDRLFVRAAAAVERLSPEAQSLCGPTHRLRRRPRTWSSVRQKGCSFSPSPSPRPAAGASTSRCRRAKRRCWTLGSAGSRGRDQTAEPGERPGGARPLTVSSPLRKWRTAALPHREPSDVRTAEFCRGHHAILGVRPCRQRVGQIR